MTDSTADPRIPVWIAMADHFLDTETRQYIPLTAMRCVEAGLTLREARDVWCYEVSPALEANLTDIAGEWAGWDHDWLVSEVGRYRQLRGSSPRSEAVESFVRTFGREIDPLRPCWTSIEHCMEELLRIDPAQRRQASLDLASLARQFFDFVPDDYTKLGDEDAARLRALYPQPFLRIVLPVVVSHEESVSGQERVRAALENAARDG